MVIIFRSVNQKRSQLRHLEKALANGSIEDLVKAIAAAKEAKVAAEHLSKANGELQRRLDERLEAAQARQLEEHERALRSAMKDSATGEEALDTLETAIHEARESGLSKTLLDEAARVLHDGRSASLARRLQSAMSTEPINAAAIQKSLTEAKKLAARHDPSAVHSSLIADAEAALHKARRASAASHALERVMEMSGAQLVRTPF